MLFKLAMHQVNKSYIRASQLILVVWAVNLTGALIPDNSGANNTTLSVLAELVIEISIIYLGLAYLIRQGYKWIRYILIILFIGGLLFGGLPSFSNIIDGILGSVSLGLQLWAIIILFRILKSQS